MVGTFCTNGEIEREVGLLVGVGLIATATCRDGSWVESEQRRGVHWAIGECSGKSKRIGGGRREIRGHHVVRMSWKLIQGKRNS